MIYYHTHVQDPTLSDARVAPISQVRVTDMLGLPTVGN
jgi:hypothetical protein